VLSLGGRAWSPLPRRPGGIPHPLSRAKHGSAPRGAAATASFCGAGPRRSRGHTSTGRAGLLSSPGVWMSVERRDKERTMLCTNHGSPVPETLLGFCPPAPLTHPSAGQCWTTCHLGATHPCSDQHRQRAWHIPLSPCPPGPLCHECPHLLHHDLPMALQFLKERLRHIGIDRGEP
jgi:hypothetical protein